LEGVPVGIGRPAQGEGETLMETDDKFRLRQELLDLRARIKPQAEWINMQDRLEQKSIEQRIRMLQNHLGSEIATKGD
jgi:hypothetical protein